MYKHFLIYFALLIVSACGTTQLPSAANQLQKEFLSPRSKTVLVAAHRGAHLQAPENSLQSFQNTIDMGVDIIELDIRHTSDGVPVLMHDRTIDRTTNGTGEIKAISFEELRKLRLTHNGELTNQIVPTLEEALHFTKGKIMIDLDIKTDQIESIIDAIVKTGVEQEVIFFVYEAELARELKATNPAFMTMIRTDNEPQIDSVFAITPTEAIHIDPSHNTESAVRKIRKQGARVWINALGDTDRTLAEGNEQMLTDLLSTGVNIIQTDQPQLLLNYLRERGLHP